MNDVQKTMYDQVTHQVFLYRGETMLVDDTTLRFVLGGVKTDVAYDAGCDLYTVTQHRRKRGTFDFVTTKTRNVFAEDLGSYFPKSREKDANVRGLFASMRSVA